MIKTWLSFVRNYYRPFLSKRKQLTREDYTLYDAQIKYFFKKCQSSISNTKLCKAMRPQRDIKLR